MIGSENGTIREPASDPVFDLSPVTYCMRDCLSLRLDLNARAPHWPTTYMGKYMNFSAMA